jgi:pimeloyl-ACP methyl ester carboxylesterase
MSAAASTMDLAFEATGIGPPVLILHGLFGSGSNWRSVARELAKAHQVFAIDLRNHGASHWSDSMSYTEMADDVHATIQSQELDRPTVIGHSMGGKTAMALALMHPESVGRLVVVDVAPVAYADRLSSYVQAMRTVDVAATASRAEVQRTLGAMIPDAGVVSFLMQNLVPRNDHFDWRLNLLGIGASMRELCGFPPELLTQRYDGPTHLIAGERSDYAAPADHAAFARLFPRLQTTIVEGAGHWVHADKPAEFLDALRAALGTTR